MNFFVSLPNLKAKVSLSDHLLSVCLSVSLSIRKLFHFQHLRITEPILTKLDPKHPKAREFKVANIKDQGQGEITRNY